MTGLRIIGMGNTRMGDDGAGMRVVQMLQEQRDSGAWDGTAELVAAGPDASLVAASLAEGTRVLLVDAVDMGCRPGQWRIFTPSRDGMPEAERAGSTHEVSVSSAIGIAAALGCEGNLRVVGIQAGGMTAGASLSPEVAASLPAVVMAVRREAEVMT